MDGDSSRDKHYRDPLMFVFPVVIVGLRIRTVPALVVRICRALVVTAVRSGVFSTAIVGAR